jgi:hypothetical protein
LRKLPAGSVQVVGATITVSGSLTKDGATSLRSALYTKISQAGTYKVYSPSDVVFYSVTPSGSRRMLRYVDDADVDQLERGLATSTSIAVRVILNPTSYDTDASVSSILRPVSAR